MPKILLIEDDRTMLTLLRTLLRFEGFDVIQLERDDSIEVIIDQMHREKPALILLDVHLRQINGFDLLHVIRQDPEFSSMRVLMSSGIDFSARCLDEGADDFILKPYMPDELVKKMHQALDSGLTLN